MRPNPYDPPKEANEGLPNSPTLFGQLYDAGLLVASMIAGGLVSSFCCINPLAHGPSPRLLVYNVAMLILGLISGGVAFKMYQRTQRPPPPPTDDRQ